MISPLDQIIQELPIIGSIGIPLGTGIVFLVRKLICKGRDDALKETRIKFLEDERVRFDDQLLAQSKEIQENKENLHILKEEVLTDLNDICEKIGNIQGKLSNLKTT